MRWSEQQKGTAYDYLAERYRYVTMMHLDKRTISNKMNCILGSYNTVLLDSAQCHTGTENVKLKYNSMNDYFVPGTPSELVVFYL